MFDERARTRAVDLYHTDLGPISTQTLSRWVGDPQLGGGGLADSGRRQPFAAAIVDLSLLVDEIRFEGALGALLIFDFNEKLSRGEVSRNEPSEGLGQLGMPVEAVALLTAYYRPPPPPETLFSDTYSAIAGHRVLGTWFAGQLLDSAIMRCIAALDRIATLLLVWMRAPRADAREDRSRWRAPTFNRKALKRLAPAFAGCPAWGRLVAYADHEIFTFAKEWRDSLVHRTRIQAALHGAGPVAYRRADVIEIVRGVDAATHLAVLLGLAPTSGMPV